VKDPIPYNTPKKCYVLLSMIIITETLQDIVIPPKGDVSEKLSQSWWMCFFKIENLQCLLNDMEAIPVP